MRALQNTLFLYAIAVFFGCAQTQTTPTPAFEQLLAIPFAADSSDSRSVHWGDFDGDGQFDIYITNGKRGGQNNLFYRSSGAAFERITNSAIALDNSPSVASTWGDYNNDGWLDLYVTTWYGQRNVLYRNLGGGQFERVEEGAIAKDLSFAEAASWGDYDNDGWLDLYMTNSEGHKRNALYHNLGDGSFEKITEGPMVEDAFISRAVNWIDIDADGDVDLFVTNESNQANNLYVNQWAETGKATFVARTEGALVTDQASSMSSSWADVDNDGDWDVYVANDNGPNALYLNDGTGRFTKHNAGDHVTDVQKSFGASWGDLDNDGDLDLFVANAYGEATPDALYRNEGHGHFSRIADTPISAHQGGSYGSTFADLDADGDLDLLVAKTDGEPNHVFVQKGAPQHYWLRVRLRGQQANRSALGATVQVAATWGGETVSQLRQLAGQDSYAGQALELHFGLGQAKHVATVEVRWPSGTRQVFERIPVNQLLFIDEAEGIVSGF